MSLTFIHAVMRATFSQFVAVSLGYFRANFDSALSPFSETSKKKNEKETQREDFLLLLLLLLCGQSDASYCTE